MKDLNSPNLYFNREWSMLDFQKRVLYEASESANPLLERAKFIAIVAKNLEEFFMVRVAILKKQAALGLKSGSPDGLSAQEQLIGIRSRVEKLIKKQYSILYKEIIPSLKKYGIELLVEASDLEPFEAYLSSLFEAQIKQVLTPISVGPTHPFPTLISGALYLAVELEPSEGRDEAIETSSLSFVEIPINIFGRFLKAGEDEIYVPIENVVKMFIDRIYNGYRLLSATVIRVTRDADFAIDVDAISDILNEIETLVNRMHQRSVVKLEYEKGISSSVLKTLVETNELLPEDLYPIEGILDLGGLWAIYGTSGKSELKDSPITPVYPDVLRDEDIFDVVSKQDVVLFHPYHTYDPVVELLSRASTDDKVLAIKQTLYRTNSNSEIVNALAVAAENGKYVTVVDELQARFDEKRNIQLAKRLEDAGAHVIYGIAGLKTHAKAMMIVRREKNGIKRYIHLATGNYNESTAKQYTDFSFFTSDDYIAEDVATFFNLLTGFSLPTGWNRLAVAPLNLRERFLSLIRRESSNAGNGIKSHIVAKMNALLDPEIIEALYEASNAGVKIELIVRGSCALKPGLKGVSENVTVRSIVGRYLEHPRVYYFYNGGEEEYYLASADWMPRNLDRRVEDLFPVLGKKERQFVQKILDIQFSDNVNAWSLFSNGDYELIEGKGAAKNSFELIYNFIREKEKPVEKPNVLFRPITSPEKPAGK